MPPEPFRPCVEMTKSKLLFEKRLVILSYMRYNMKKANECSLKSPVYDESGSVVRYNVFRVEMLIRHSSNGKRYLYDMVNIKRRNEHPV